MAKNHRRNTNILVGIAEFSNGKRLRIDQIKTSGACSITDMNTGVVQYARNIPNAWKALRFMAHVRKDTQNTTKWRPDYA